MLDFTAKSRSDPSIQMKLNTKRTYLTLQHMHVSSFPAGMTNFRQEHFFCSFPVSTCKWNMF